MLVKGETFNQRRSSLLNMVSVCRAMIRAVNDVIKKHPDWDHKLAWEVIEGNRSIIKTTMQELVELKKWQKARVNARSTTENV